MTPCLSLGARRPGLPAGPALAAALLVHLLVAVLLAGFLPGRPDAPAPGPALEVEVVGMGAPLAVAPVAAAAPEAAGPGEPEAETVPATPAEPALRPVEEPPAELRQIDELPAVSRPVERPAPAEPAVETLAPVAPVEAVAPRAEEMPPLPPVRPAELVRASPQAPAPVTAAPAPPRSSTQASGQPPAQSRRGSPSAARDVPAGAGPASSAGPASPTGPAAPVSAVPGRGSDGAAAEADAARGTQDYVARLAAWLERHRRYPKRARLLRQEGVAVVRFRIDRRGRLLDSRLQRSSGHELLDDEALALLKRSAPLPAPDGAMGGAQEFVLPIRFELR